MYVAHSRGFQPDSPDFVLVAGQCQDACACALLDKLRLGGVLVVRQRQLVLALQVLFATFHTLAQGPASTRWADFLAAVKGWRCIWTSSGVTDTAFYFKPCRY